LRPGETLTQVRPSTAVVEALLEVAKIRDFRDTWLAAADVTTIINEVFGLPRTAKYKVFIVIVTRAFTLICVIHPVIVRVQWAEPLAEVAHNQ